MEKKTKLQRFLYIVKSNIKLSLSPKSVKVINLSNNKNNNDKCKKSVNIIS